MKKISVQKKASLGQTAWILVIAGSLNWLLFGLFGINLVKVIFKEGFLAHLVYIIIGAAAIYLVMNYKHTCICGGKGCDLCVKKKVNSKEE